MPQRQKDKCLECNQKINLFIIDGMFQIGCRVPKCWRGPLMGNRNAALIAWNKAMKQSVELKNLDEALIFEYK